MRGDTRAVEEKLRSLSSEECVELARSFACFGQLTNAVEDLERADSISDQEGDLKGAVAEIGEANKNSFFQDFFVSPVLTAHPTQVVRSTQVK